jgi:hypothetical protein
LTRKKNSAANNYDFDRKKSAYFAKGGVSPFALTTQVLGRAEWTATELEDRQTQLMELLEQEWRLEDRESPQATIARKLALQSAGDQPVEFELSSAKLNLQAEARMLDDAFVVLQGSKAKAAWTGVGHGYKALRQALEEEGALVPDGKGALVFARNTAFSSPSAASAVIFGRPDNGRTSWMLKGTELSYADWLESALSGEQGSLVG